MDGKTGLVIANYNETDSVRIRAVLKSGAALTPFRLVDDPAWKPVSAEILIPDQSAAVMI